jgi:hypothetical protein
MVAREHIRAADAATKPLRWNIAFDQPQRRASAATHARRWIARSVSCERGGGFRAHHHRSILYAISLKSFRIPGTAVQNVARQ